MSTLVLDCVSLLPLLAPAAHPGSGPPAGTGWEATELHLEVVLIPEDRRLSIYGTLRLTLAADRSPGPTLAIDGERTGARFLRLDGPVEARVELNRAHPTLEGVLLADLRSEDAFERGDVLELGFEIEAAGRDGQFVVSDDVALASWTTSWYPVPLEDPRANVRRATLMSVPGTTTLHLPAGWTSASNGTRAERIEREGGVSETWRIEQPVARSFAAGPFRVGVHELDGRSFAVYLLGRSPEEAQVHARALADSIRAMEARFGPYPYPTFGIVEVPQERVSFYGSSEQGFLMAASEAFTYGANLPLFAHEASHAWWGNLVGSRGPASILLDESLAQYGAVVAIEALEGEEAVAEFLRFSREGYAQLQCARGYFEMARAGNDKPLIELTSGGWDHQLSDSKGNWLYHMLRDRVGDEVFFETLRGLIAGYSDRLLTLRDLRAAFRAAAPDRDLERFFEQWLERTGAPELELEWEQDGGALRGVVRQVQEGEPYLLDVELGIRMAGELRLERVATDERERTFELAVGGSVDEVLLDPRHRILRWTSEYGERP